MRKMMLAAAIMLGGCTTAEQSADAKATNIESEMRAYFLCGLTAADRMALSNEDAYYIAVAAQNMCGRERLDLARKIEQTYDASIWNRLKESHDQTLIDGAITRVVRRRQTG